MDLAAREIWLRIRLSNLARLLHSAIISDALAALDYLTYRLFITFKLDLFYYPPPWLMIECLSVLPCMLYLWSFL